MPNWIRKWEVPSSSGKGVWVVSLSDTGEYGCACPVWKYKREKCKHIIRLQNNLKLGQLGDIKEIF